VKWNLDPSRRPVHGVVGKHVDDLGDPVFLPVIVGSGGWRHDIAADAQRYDTNHYSNDVLDHIDGRCRKQRDTLARDKTAGEEGLAVDPSSFPEGGTGQRPNVMAGYSCLLTSKSSQELLRLDPDRSSGRGLSFSPPFDLHYTMMG
jgi:hypothetical protein